MEILKSEKSIKDLKKRIKVSNKNMKPNILVLCGGKSFEHDISILTAQTIASEVPSKYNTYIIYQSLDGDFYLVPNDSTPKDYKTKNQLLKVNFIINNNYLFESCKKLLKVDVVINCTHGQNCEDGTLTHLLNLCNIPSTNANATCQAITLDKEFMKYGFTANGFLTPEFVVLKKGDDINELLSEIQYPVIVKPCNLGSSIGIVVCEDEKSLLKAVEFAQKFDDKLIIEQYLSNVIEVNCAGRNINGKIEVSKCEVPHKSQQFLSFNDKYLSGAKGKGKSGGKIKNTILQKTTFVHSEGDNIVKDDENTIEKLAELNEISQDLIEKVQDTTLSLFKLFDCEGVVRIDYLIFDNQIYVNEINTIPGSLAYYLWDDDFSGYVDMLITSAYKLFKHKQSKNYYFETNIF